MDDIEFAQTIYIKQEEVPLFKVAWENLMTKFKIPELQQAPLFEIMQTFYLTFEHHALYIYELNCAIEAIDFFMEYTERFDKLKEGKTELEIDKYAKVQFEIAAYDIMFKYPSISQIAFKALYNHFRDNDNFLRHYFYKFEQPPSTIELREIKSQLGNQQDDGMQYYVVQHIETLKAHIHDHLAKELSKKVNYFIFELLYLFNIIQYAGKVGGVNSNIFKLSEASNSAKFNPYTTMEATAKSRFITDIVANAVKREKATT